MDLTFHNAENVSSALSPHNRIPRITVPGFMLSNDFERLTLERNQIAFAGFFDNRDRIRSANDPDGKDHYANSVSRGMQLLLDLEQRKDADGNPAPQDLESVLKHVIGGVMGTTVDDWKALPKPTPEQIKAIREHLMRVPEIKKH